VIYGIKLVASYLLGKDVVGRRVAVFPDDTFVVSYPRSGNTWTRFLIANLLHPELEVTFANIERLIPDTSSQSSRTLKHTPRPRFIKAHEYFDHRYKRVVYVVRDPRDVVLSYYDFQRKYRQIEDGHPIERYVDDFLRGRLISAGWGTWAENVGSWIWTRGKDKNFLLIRYEDLLADTPRELARIAVFLGIDPLPRLLRRAIEQSSADRMRELEKLQADDWVATKHRRKDIPFIGSAAAGGWRTNLPERSLVQIESAWGELMTTLGYEPVSANLCAVGGKLHFG
jgi:hypothetical protein